MQVIESGSSAVAAVHARDGEFRAVEDTLVEEAALEIRVNGAAYSMTMRTPGYDGELAVGLLHAEGRLAGAAEVLSVRENGDVVELELRTAGVAAPARRLVANAACGVCGLESAAELAAPVEVDRGGAALDLGGLAAMEGKVRAAQALFGRTGGSHAAAVFDAEGDLLALREDVGRHNAVDKAVGHLLMRGGLARAHALFVSGRVSYEIVAKATRAGVPFLLAVSAPSTLAVRMCAEAGICLLAFCRGGKATVYTHPERVRWGGA